MTSVWLEEPAADSVINKKKVSVKTQILCIMCIINQCAEGYFSSQFLHVRDDLNFAMLF